MGGYDGVDAVEAATADRATVTPDGEPLARIIDGVRIRRSVVHVDHRGRVSEIVNSDQSFWDVPVVHTYLFSVRPGVIKGWGI
ncbi:MAG: hypothetical protein ACLGHQ_12170, partial [Acidimicrobiia bacterium]